MRRATQRDRILTLLHERGEQGITRWDAAKDVGCFELSATIIALERLGCVIPREPESGRNRYGDATRFVRYRLEYAPPDVLGPALSASYRLTHGQAERIAERVDR